MSGRYIRWWLAVRTSCLTRWEKRLSVDWRTKSSSAAPTIATAITATANQELGRRGLGEPRCRDVRQRERSGVPKERIDRDSEEHRWDQREEPGDGARQHADDEPPATATAELDEQPEERMLDRLTSLFDVLSVEGVVRTHEWFLAVGRRRQNRLGKARTPDRFFRLHHRTRCSHRAGTVTSAARRDRRVRPRTDSRLRSTPTPEGGSETPRRARRRDRRVPPCPRCGSSRRRSGR